ncbi:MAG: hypothetical protein Fur0041_16330 [Bacteroidia bacterium]
MKHALRYFISGIVLFTSLQAEAQSWCNNRDFEDTTFTGWTGGSGSNLNGVLFPMNWTGGFVINGHNAAISDPNARHTIITQNFLDPNTIDPNTMQPDTQMTSLAPGGGSVTVRLGNSNIGAECEKLSYQFTVTPRNSYFQFQFASVQEDPGHPWDAQPFFMVNFYDQNNNPISSVCDTFWAADPSVPFIQSANNMNWLYRRWTPVSADLTAYIGQQVTVEFVNSDCMYAGHFGYTYIDVSCLGLAVPNV